MPPALLGISRECVFVVVFTSVSVDIHGRFLRLFLRVHVFACVLLFVCLRLFARVFDCYFAFICAYVRVYLCMYTYLGVYLRVYVCWYFRVYLCG